MSYTTLHIMAERTRRILESGGVGRDNKWDLREIAETLRDSALFLMKGEWFQQRQIGDVVIPPHYVATFDYLEIKTDSHDREYVLIPAPRVNLPDDGGIQRVRPITEDGYGKTMIPIPQEYMDVIGKLPTGFVEGNWTYFVGREKIIFQKKGTKTLADEDIDKVSIDVVTMSPSDVGMNDPFPAPPELIQQIIARTLEIFGLSQKPQDILLDENPNN